MKNIKLLRVTKDMSQLKLQMDTGIDRASISQYERGAAIPTTENLMILAKYFSTSMDFLMDLTDERKPYPSKK